MKKQPNPPFLELNFYIADLHETDAFLKLITSLVALGAQFTGKGSAHIGPDVSNSTFASISDMAREKITVSSMADVERYIADPDHRLIDVSMLDATNTVHDVAEIVTLQSISEEAAQVDQHPLAIWTDGDLTSGPPSYRPKHNKRAMEVGGQIYRRFQALIESLQPAYAAITVEYGLECPADLKLNPKSLAFEDFFVSRSYLGASSINRIQDLFSDAYIETVGDGIYVSCFEMFNPEGKSCDSKYATTQSFKVAEIIASSTQVED